MALRFSTSHSPRRVIERMCLISPEYWQVKYIPLTIDEYAISDEIQHWVETHHDGRFITMYTVDKVQKTVEFERENEYIEFILRWM